MNRYDTTFILNPQIGDEGIASSIKKVTEIITSNKGQILRENRMGSRKMTFAMRKIQHGYYVSFVYEADSAVVKKLDTHFRLDDDCLRHLTIRFDGDPFRQSVSEQFTFETRRRPDAEDGPEEGESRGRTRRGFLRAERNADRNAERPTERTTESGAPTHRATE